MSSTVATRLARGVGWLGFLTHLAMVLLFAASGLVAPGWAVAGLLVVWFFLVGVSWRMLQQRPLWTLAVPVLDIALWLSVVSLGDAVLGWTA